MRAAQLNNNLTKQVERVSWHQPTPVALAAALLLSATALHAQQASAPEQTLSP
jgi:hypothetical protein